jgi:hypothetical protein
MAGRLKPGISPRQARIGAGRVGRNVMRTSPAMMAGLHISAVLCPLEEGTVAETRPLVRALLPAVAVVLVIACVHLAGLTLVRAIRRLREVAVRLFGNGGSIVLEVGIAARADGICPAR